VLVRSNSRVEVSFLHGVSELADFVVAARDAIAANFHQFTHCSCVARDVVGSYVAADVTALHRASERYGTMAVSASSARRLRLRKTRRLYRRSRIDTDAKIGHGHGPAFTLVGGVA